MEALTAPAQALPLPCSEQSEMLIYCPGLSSYLKFREQDLHLRAANRATCGVLLQLLYHTPGPALNSTLFRADHRGRSSSILYRLKEQLPP